MTATRTNTTRMPGCRPARFQRGAALIIALIILLVMTMIGISASQTTVLQERMAGNLRQKEVAFEAAEIGLRMGEGWVRDQIGGTRPDVTPQGQSTFDPFDPTDWSAASPIGTLGQGGIAMDLAEDPKFDIVELEDTGGSFVIGMHTDTASSSKRLVYQITVRAVGENSSAESILRSMYAERF